MSSTKYTAIFQPEAWQRDRAVPIDPEGPPHVPADPEGPTSWDCTAAVNERLDYFTRLFARNDKPVVDVDDYLKSDPAAPEWVRSWTGPFTIRVMRSDVLRFAAGSDVLELEGEPYTWD